MSVHDRYYCAYMFNSYISAIKALIKFKRHRAIKDRHIWHTYDTTPTISHKSIVYYVTVFCILRHHSTFQYTINTILLQKVLYTYKHSQELRQWEIVSAYISFHRVGISYVTNILSITLPLISRQCVASD